MTHAEKIEWMHRWCAKHGAALDLHGEIGFGREAVLISIDGLSPDYRWYDENTCEIADNNGDVWCPPDAYHKHECVAVLGRGVDAEGQLYDWLRWFDDNGFVIKTGSQPMDPRLGIAGLLLGKNRYARMVRSAAKERTE